MTSSDSKTVAGRINSINNNHKRRFRIYNNGGNGVTPQQIQDLLLMSGYRCGYCGQNFEYLEDVGRFVYHVEHNIPISRGGPHSIENIIISCPQCNARKHVKTASEFLTEKRDDSTAFYKSWLLLKICENVDNSALMLPLIVEYCQICDMMRARDKK